MSRAVIDDHVRIALHDLATIYVAGSLYDNATVYAHLYRTRDHLDAALAILEQP
jgi:hypothetical protein